MKIAIAADHAGFVLKEALRVRLRQQGHEVDDLGTRSEESTDYPDYAFAVARRVARGDVERGVLVCHTGIGMSIAANKVAGVRAAVAVNEDTVRLTREHNDANVLALGAMFTTATEAERYVESFLQTPFSGGERHARRITKLARIEEDGT